MSSRDRSTSRLLPRRPLRAAGREMGASGRLGCMMLLDDGESARGWRKWSISKQPINHTDYKGKSEKRNRERDKRKK